MCYIIKDSSNRRTKMGAAIGAVTGAAIGSRNDGDDALKGAIIGGIAGAGIGAYMDKQAAELRDELSASGVSVSRDGNNIVLNMPENITFATGKSNIQRRFQPTLDDVSRIFAKYKDTNIEIAGHTDSVGSEEYNQSLSERRARSVSYYLSRRNVSINRITATGYGEASPIASNSSKNGRARNRRVEITIIPIGK